MKKPCGSSYLDQSVGQVIPGPWANGLIMELYLEIVMSYPHIMHHGSVNGSCFQLQMDTRNHSKQLIAIGGNAQYMRTCHYLVVTGRSVMVDASSGICASGRIVYDLKVMSSLSGHNMIFTRYQGQYRAGSVIQKNDLQSGIVESESERCIIRAGIYTWSGYSAHAGQQDLLKFASSIESAGKNTSGAWRNSGKSIGKSSWGCINHVINLSMY